MIRSSFRILVILVILGIVFYMMNTGHVSSKERLKGSSMVLCFGQLRTEIDPYLLDGQLVPTGIKNPCNKHITELDISQHGVISMNNKQYAISLVFEPQKIENKILWSCKGKPEEYVPKRCRVN